jgi:hypothetical protein
VLPAAKSSCAIVSDFVPKRANGNYLKKPSFPLDHGRWHATIRPVNVKEDKMAKAKSKIAPAKSSDRDGNRYTRAARVLAKDDTIDVKTLADRAFMSETTAARCKEAWDAVIVALIEVGRLPDPAKAAAKKIAAKNSPKPLDAQPAAAGPTQSVEQKGTVVDTGAAAVF